MTAYRIAKAIHRDTPITGTGAFKFGGRWNSPGRYAVYASAHHSLAMLELLVHIDDADSLWRTPHVYLALSFPTESVAILQESELPAAWNARPAARVSQAAGDEWLDGLESPVLAVPSVVTPTELRYDPGYLNFVINPKHPRFGTEVEVGQVRDLTWDVRLMDGL